MPRTLVIRVAASRRICADDGRGSMKNSSDVSGAWMQFCELLSAGEVARFDDVVSQEAKVVIGSAPGEIIEDRARMRFGFEAEGVTMTPASPQGYEEGTMGWIVDQPAFGLPDGSAVGFRVTSVFRQEDGA